MRGDYCVPDPIVADPDGQERIPYTPTADETCIDPESGSEVNELSSKIQRTTGASRKSLSF